MLSTLWIIAGFSSLSSLVIYCRFLKTRNPHKWTNWNCYIVVDFLYVFNIHILTREFTVGEYKSRLWLSQTTCLILTFSNIHHMYRYHQAPIIRLWLIFIPLILFVVWLHISSWPSNLLTLNLGQLWFITNISLMCKCHYYPTIN